MSYLYKFQENHFEDHNKNNTLDGHLNFDHF